MQTIKFILILFSLHLAQATDVKLKDIFNEDGEDFHLVIKMPYTAKKEPIKARCDLIVEQLEKIPGREEEIIFVKQIKRILGSDTLKIYIYNPLMKSVQNHKVKLPKGFARYLAPAIAYYEEVHVPRVTQEEAELALADQAFDRDYDPTVHYRVFKKYLIDFYSDIFSTPTFPPDFLETLWKDMLQPVPTQQVQTFFGFVKEHNKLIKRGTQVLFLGSCAWAFLAATHFLQPDPALRFGDTVSTAPSEVQNVVSPEKGAEELGDKLFRKLNQGK